MENSSVRKDLGVLVDDRAKLFIVVHGGRMRGNKHMLKHVELEYRGDLSVPRGSQAWGKVAQRGCVGQRKI